MNKHFRDIKSIDDRIALYDSLNSWEKALKIKFGPQCTLPSSMPFPSCPEVTTIMYFFIMSIFFPRCLYLKTMASSQCRKQLWLYCLDYIYILY